MSSHGVDQATANSRTNVPGRLGCVIEEPADEYHAKAAEYLSSHGLADFRKCPLLFHKKRQGLVEDEDRPAYLIGRALHTLVLEGRERFDAEYAVGGPINPSTGAPYGPTTKAFAEWSASCGKRVLTETQYDLVRKMAEGVRAHQVAMDFLSSGIPEGVVRAEYCGLPCQIRMDWFDPHRGIVDLKTCDDLTWFEADAKRYGYTYQVAFYRAVLRQVIGLPMPVYFIAVEKKEPFRCGVWQVHEEDLADSCLRGGGGLGTARQAQRALDGGYPRGADSQHRRSDPLPPSMLSRLEVVLRCAAQRGPSRPASAWKSSRHCGCAGTSTWLTSPPAEHRGSATWPGSSPIGGLISLFPARSLCAGGVKNMEKKNMEGKKEISISLSFYLSIFL